MDIPILICRSVRYLHAPRIRFEKCIWFQIYLVWLGIDETRGNFVCICIRISRGLRNFVRSTQLNIRAQQV